MTCYESWARVKPEADGKRLVVLYDGRRAAAVTEGPDGRLSLEYDDGWRRSPSAVPLSLSMPLTTGFYGDKVVRAYLWGLLPDSERAGTERSDAARPPGGHVPGARRAADDELPERGRADAGTDRRPPAPRGATAGPG